MLTVNLANIGNPDFKEDSSMPLPDTDCYTAKVSDFAAASRTCLEYIRDYGLGGGNWSGGQVFDEGGSTVAYVSYNGRVWPPGDYDTEAKCLYEPEPNWDPSFLLGRGKKRKPIPLAPRYPRPSTPDQFPDSLQDCEHKAVILAWLQRLIDNGPSKRPTSNHVYDYPIHYGLTEFWVRILGTEEYRFMSELDRTDLFWMGDRLEAITPEGRKAVAEWSWSDS